MAGCLKSDQWIVHALRLPVSLRLTPITCVANNPINKFVMSDVLRALVGIAAARPRCADKGEPDGVIVRLVRPILAVSQNCCAKLAGRVRQVDPLVRGNLELFRLGGWPLDGANIPVIA